MAEMNYKRLGCVKCDESLFRKLINPGAAKRSYTPKNPPGARECATCKAAFWGSGKKKFCSQRCRDGSLMTRDEWRKIVRVKSKAAFTCMHCGVCTSRRMSSTNKKKGCWNKFCSMPCKIAAYDRIRKEVDFLRRLAERIAPDAAKQARAIRDVARAIAAVARKQVKALKPCAICGKAVGYEMGAPKKYCSDTCIKVGRRTYKKTEAAKAIKRAAKSRRRALKRGSKQAVRIDPIKVFDRDGWRCQICGVSTPHKLRGTHKNRAPELDHIVPLSKGGPHTWGNVQCACRECNNLKSNKSCAGQMGLFTALA
jgi:5-methylcytosine-specific restriction endonuclease McrA